MDVASGRQRPRTLMAFGIPPVVRRSITARRVQPLLPLAYYFESLYLYGYEFNVALGR